MVYTCLKGGLKPNHPIIYQLLECFIQGFNLISRPPIYIIAPWFFLISWVKAVEWETTAWGSLTFSSVMCWSTIMQCSISLKSYKNFISWQQIETSSSQSWLQKTRPNRALSSWLLQIFCSFCGTGQTCKTEWSLWVRMEGERRNVFLVRWEFQCHLGFCPAASYPIFLIYLYSYSLWFIMKNTIEGRVR